MADLDAATSILSRKLKRSLSEIACEGRLQEVREAVTAMLDLRRIQR